MVSYMPAHPIRSERLHGGYGRELQIVVRYRARYDHRESRKAHIDAIAPRKIRRRKSDPFAPKSVNGSRMFYVKSKGWVICVQPQKPSPGSDSGTSTERRRRFVKAQLRAKADKNANKRGTRRHRKKDAPDLANRVLAQDDTDDDEEDPYAS